MSNRPDLCRRWAGGSWHETMEAPAHTAKSMLTEKKADRDRIAADVEAFLANGGEIQQFDACSNIINDDGTFKTPYPTTVNFHDAPKRDREAIARSMKRGGAAGSRESAANKRTRKEVRDEWRQQNWSRREALQRLKEKAK